VISLWRVGAAFFLRDMRIALTYRAGFALTILGAFVNTLGIFFLSQTFGGLAAPLLAPYGGSYFGFAIVGVALTNFMAVGISGMASRIREGQMTGTLEIMLLSPNRLAVLLLGSTLWSHLLAIVMMIPYVIAAIVLGLDISRADLPVVVVGLFLALVSFNALGLLAASFVILIKQGDPVTWVVSTASVLLAGVFYPTSVLPDWLRAVGQLLPLTHALELLRRAIFRGEGFATLWPSVLALLLLTMVFVGLGLLATRVAIRIAQRDGSLSYY
jgi:ABC-2 type transport system permease protein